MPESLRAQSRPDYYPRIRIALIVVGSAFVSWTLIEIARGRTNPMEWSLLTVNGLLVAIFFVYLGIWCFVPWVSILDEEGVTLMHGPFSRHLPWRMAIQMTLCGLGDGGGKVYGVTFRSSKKNVDLGIEFRRQDLRTIAEFARNRLERRGVRIVEAANLEALYNPMERDPTLKP